MGNTNDTTFHQEYKYTKGRKIIVGVNKPVSLPLTPSPPPPPKYKTVIYQPPKLKIDEPE